MNHQEADVLRALVSSVLENADLYEWSVQGFGMMRTYLDKDKKYRLNVWHSSLAVPDVSIIHDHPWNFRSWIIAGKFTNIRYVQHDPSLSRLYSYMRIKTGPGGGPDGKPGSMFLCGLEPEVYTPGDTYEQEASEIHASHYEDGTVTINDRTRVGTGEHALVFWPHGQQWVDAIPRVAQPSEVERISIAAMGLLT